MATKKEPIETVEEVDTSELINTLPSTPLIDALPRLKSDRRQSLVDTFTVAILTGVKFDLDGKIPSQEQRNKIVNFAVKMADDVIAATN